jgi:hypothetical protein
MRDPKISDILRFMAKSKARGDETGWCEFGRVAVAYYPRCGRYTWFMDGDPITKKEAVKWLVSPNENGGMSSPTSQKPTRSKCISTADDA